MLILLMEVLTLTAQIEKGRFFVNGLNVMSVQVGSIKDAFGESNSKSTFSSFSIGPFASIGPFSSIPSLVNSPSLNYSFSDHLTGGIFLNLALSGGRDTLKYTNSGIIVGPTIRYYLIAKKKFMPFIEGLAGIGSTSTGYGTLPADKSTVFGWHLGTGATYFFSPKVGADFTLGYENIEEKIKGSSTKSTFGFAQFGVGVLVIF